MSCKDFEEKIFKLSENLISEEEKSVVLNHINECNSCNTFYKNLLNMNTNFKIEKKKIDNIIIFDKDIFKVELSEKIYVNKPKYYFLKIAVIVFFINILYFSIFFKIPKRQNNIDLNRYYSNVFKNKDINSELSAIFENEENFNNKTDIEKDIYNIIDNKSDESILFDKENDLINLDDIDFDNEINI